MQLADVSCGLDFLALMPRGAGELLLHLNVEVAPLQLPQLRLFIHVDVAIDARVRAHHVGQGSGRSNGATAPSPSPSHARRFRRAPLPVAAVSPRSAGKRTSECDGGLRGGAGPRPISSIGPQKWPVSAALL